LGKYRQMARLQSRKTIIKKLDSVFSEYIRKRKAKNNIAECVTCGKKDHWKSLQAGHFMSRKHYSTRWDERNVEVQCVSCNVYRYGEQYKFSKFLGDELADELLALSRETRKFSNFEIEEMIEQYCERLERLEKK
jgi:hypothetical protein